MIFLETNFKKADPATREAIGAILNSDSFRDEQSVYSRSGVRKAFVCGANERSINTDYFETLAFPNTWQQKIYRIPESSHVPHWENATVVNELIDRFVSGSQ